MTRPEIGNFDTQKKSQFFERISITDNDFRIRQNGGSTVRLAHPVMNIRLPPSQSLAVRPVLIQ